MTKSTHLSDTPRAGVERIVADLGEASAGPTLIAVGAVHGNEPAGVEALRRVARRLEEGAPAMRGRFLALAGNLDALSRGTRYIGRDLNRHWPIGAPPSDDAPATHTGEDDASERAARADLAKRIEQAIDAASSAGPVYFMDLHTTSAPSAPFAVINDAIPCRDFALRLGVPVILGLEEHVRGTLPDFALHRGAIAVGFEAGAHDDPRSVELHEAALWTALVSIGAIAPDDAPRLAAHRRALSEAARGLPAFVEVIHRHPVQERRQFQMAAGYRNFARVARGEPLAQDHGAPLLAARDARIFMPLYQPLGDDGYFLVRAVHPFWLWLSRWIRAAGGARLAPLLPGVRRDGNDRRVVLVDPRVARLLRTQALHLLGYRRMGERDGLDVYRRRELGAGV